MKPKETRTFLPDVMKDVPEKFARATKWTLG